ncbi:transcriptional regulator [Mycobacterium asiaticum]|uniref:Transcriptional regulator n=1 Tax=Mycobacterium asiaticum TaxID=1790 RepID=A0A1A3MNC7_MYCAS|nr:transcriptional regulator [Mycobacterium asiaticum]
MSGLPTGTVTMLLADIEGSTRLWETQPAEMTAAVALLDRTLDGLLATYGGVRPVEQGEGDSFVVGFARASQAVACALDLQRAPLAPLRFRIGLHTGEVQLRDENNYIGPTVNRTARLRDLAHGGQTVLSGTTEDLVVDALPADAWLTDLGTHELRGVARPERVVQLCHPDIKNNFPPLNTPKRPVGEHLPAQLTSFVGRSGEVADLRQMVAAERLVVLTGTGGVGKTRLAIQVAGQLTADFDAGVWFVDLAPITDPGLVPATAAEAVGLSEQPGRSTTEAVARYVSDRRMLMVLDNCEHLVDAVAVFVTVLLGACPSLTLLATSREPIGVAGEVTWRVPSLSLEDEAVDLFVDRARRVRPDFATPDDQVSQIAQVAQVREICRRLDGMPLAIELAAARVRALSLDEIEGSLTDRFRLLTGGRRTAVRRQQTLRASVDWSHALLTEPEQVLFRRLAPFMGGFDLTAARAVAGDNAFERFQLLDQLTLLVDKSLVVADNTGDRTRYRLPETVRQYALEKLGESGEADAVRARHRDYYTTMAAMLDAPAATGHQRRVEDTEVEIDNLRAAFGWSLENLDIELALQIASSLQPLWLTRGRLREGLGWIDEALAGSVEAEVAPAVLARALADAALFDGWVGVPARREQATEALAIARQLDDPALLVRALTGCVGTAAFEPEQAATYFAEAIELARDLDDKWRLSQLLGFQAYAATMAGACISEAAAAEGRDLAEAIGDRVASGQCRLWGIAGGRTMRGDLQGAEDELHDLLADAEAAGDLFSRFNALMALSFVLGRHGKTVAALAAVETAVESVAELGAAIEGLGYLALGWTLLAAGDVAAARDALAKAYGRIPDAGFASTNLMWRAQGELAAGNVVAARRWADQGVAATAGYFRMLALNTRARVALAEDHPESVDAAERDLHEALACAAETGAQLGVPDVFEGLGELAARASSHSEAARLFGAAEAVRRRTGEVRYAIHQADYEKTVSALRDAMGHNDFDTAFAEGAALSTAGAIAYAKRGRGERKRPSTGWASLTPAERDVVGLLREGLANKDIAARLFISPRTVETHLTHVYTKLGLSSRVQLAQEAARHA